MGRHWRPAARLDSSTARRHRGAGVAEATLGLAGAVGRPAVKGRRITATAVASAAVQNGIASLQANGSHTGAGWLLANLKLYNYIVYSAF